MTAGWIAPVVRGRALLTRTLGPVGARRVAAADGWSAALEFLRPTVYGRDLTARASLADARRTTATVTAWQLRVLAGWLPPGGVALARLGVAPFEIGHVEQHIAAGADAPRRGPVPLGSLAGVTPLLARAGSRSSVRDVLARSVWGDPGGDEAVDISLGMRIAWAERALRAVPDLAPWALGALALLAARERFVFEREPNPTLGRRLDRRLGRRSAAATDLVAFRAALPEAARWPLAAVDTPSELWRAELAILDRVARDAHDLATSGRPGRSTAAAIVALLLVDLWRVHAALETAALDGAAGPAAMEVLDAVA